MYPNQFHFISGENEQYPGLADKLANGNAKHIIIKGLDEHSRIWSLVREFKGIINTLFPAYVTVQTNWQLLIVVLTKYLTASHYSIVYIVRGYRHNHRYKSALARLLIGCMLRLFARKVITPSSFVRNRFGFLGKKNEIVFLGEDAFFLKDHAAPIFNSKKFFVFGGEFRTGKNQELLIRALKGYITKSNDSDVALYLPGQGEKLEKCKLLSMELGIADYVFFPGFLSREEMHALYLKCQFALVPSNVETFGHCIVEPLLLGRIVFTRHVGVADDVIINGHNGFFFDDEKSLVEKLLKVVGNVELCKAVSHNATKDKWRFSWEQVCREQYERIYAGKTIKTED